MVEISTEEKTSGRTKETRQSKWTQATGEGSRDSRNERRMKNTTWAQAHTIPATHALHGHLLPTPNDKPEETRNEQNKNTLFQTHRCMCVCVLGSMCMVMITASWVVVRVGVFLLVCVSWWCCVVIGVVVVGVVVYQDIPEMRNI